MAIVSKYLKYLYLLVVIHFSGLGSLWYRSSQALYVLFGLTVAVFIYYRINISKKLLLVIAIWFLYNFIMFIAFGRLRGLFIGNYLTIILISFLLVKLYGNSLGVVYAKIIFYFALISIPFWIWANIHPSSLVSVMRSFNFSHGYLSRRMYLHSIVYTFVALSPASPVRNYGFCWEPGPFSIILAVALYFTINSGKAKSFQFWVIVIAMITTFSTTGYFALFMVLSYPYLMKARFAYRIPLFVAIIVLFYYTFVDLDFMGDKLSRQVQVFDYYSDIGEIITTDYVPRAGRFAGFIKGISTLYSYPFGLAGNYELQVKTQGLAVSGIGDLLANFGIFTMIILILIKNSSVFLSKIFLVKDRYSFLMIIIVALLGFSVLTRYVLGAFAICGLWYSGSHNDNYYKTLINNNGAQETQSLIK